MVGFFFRFRRSFTGRLKTRTHYAKMMANYATTPAGTAMSEPQTFARPLVKTVIFQARYPSLLFLESRIGEFQVKIMSRFPNSNLVSRRSLLLTNAVDHERLGELAQKAGEQKIWQFESAKGVRVDVSNDSLSLVTENHPGYESFREHVGFVLDQFLGLTGLPLIKRLGLRYINECPLPAANRFQDCYNSALPLHLFSLEGSSKLEFEAVTRRGQHQLRYLERLEGDGPERKYSLDLDAYAVDLSPESLTEQIDRLHALISETFDSAVKEPIRAYMRGEDLPS